MEELRIELDGFSLAASYSPGGPTALVALHGAGEGTRDSPSLRHLHELLPPHGIGVVTFDRRGEGESTGDATRGRFDLQADDALAVLRAIDAERVGLFGYSQGGWIAPIAAARSREVAFLVLVASIGVTPSEQMMVAVERQLRLAGYGDDVVERALDLRRRQPFPRPQDRAAPAAQVVQAPDADPARAPDRDKSAVRRRDGHLTPISRGRLVERVRQVRRPDLPPAQRVYRPRVTHQGLHSGQAHTARSFAEPR
jgi:pimeloyl-ACP methyl ester carboxylesterase